MKRSKRNTKKKRGRPATGQDPVTAIRLPQDMLATLDLWRPVSDARSRSEFIRWLVIDGLNALTRKRQRYAESHKAETHARLMDGASAFTPEREREFTKAIKERMLYEGACDLPWPQYVAFRKTHDCEPLADSDLAYAEAFASCAVRPKARRVRPV